MYTALDDSVYYALFASRQAIARAGWQQGAEFGINIGSSRGATGLFEKYHEDFLRDGRSTVLASPTTTLGNISSWIAHDLKSAGPQISHSITCSTALHALLNGVAWIRSGMADKFLVGGSEAPLTPFTMAQMMALKIYASPVNGPEPEFPGRALDLNKTKNAMVLGEGAAVACLEAGIPGHALAVVEGVGYATEPLTHSVSLSAQATCIQDAMRMALGNLDPAEVDAAVLHAPGTIKGDQAEFKAMECVFGSKMPAITSNKWKIGHSFGASGLLSLELAVMMLQHNRFIGLPFQATTSNPGKLKRILINAVGFGGNAVSVLLRKP